MSRKLLAFLLSELEIVRIKCAKCQFVAEMPIHELGNFAALKCSFCGKTLVVNPSNLPIGPLGYLAQAIKEIKLQVGSVEVEFVLEDKSSN